jgi:hypothetical protein
MGRALRLIIMNCAGAYPGRADRSTLGHAGKYAWCIGEDETDARWTPLHVERGFSPQQGAVTTFWGLSSVQVGEHQSADPEPIVAAIGRAFRSGGIAPAREQEVVVVIGGEHRETIAGAGWTKRDVRACLFEHAPGPPVASPDDFLVVAAGGSGGRFSAYVPSWGNKRGHQAVTKPIDWRGAST